MTAEVAAKADDLVPFDTGTLSNTQSIRFPAAISGNDIKGQITYGGPSAPYAVVQHENVDLWHPPKPPGNTRGRTGTGPVSPGQGRGPKYLEYPLKMAFRDYDKKIVNRIKALLR